MIDQWTDRLSEYLDGALERAERDALERHLADCASCRGVLADLGHVVERARSLPDRPPARDLWAGISARLTPGRRPGVSPPGPTLWHRRRVSFTVPQLAAAAVVLMLLAGGLAVILRPGAVQAPIAVIPGRFEPRLTPVSTPRLDAAVARLEQSLIDGRGRLDTATVRVIEKSLAIIDRAIAEAQQALERDPGNTYLNHHLTNQKLRKLELLRRANALTVARS